MTDLALIESTLAGGDSAQAAILALEHSRSDAFPHVVYRLWRAGRVKHLAAAVGDAWVLHGSPAYAMSETRWVELFRAAGLVVRTRRTSQAVFGHVLTVPAEPFTVYRGAPTVASARGMSWTLYENCARNFARVWAERTQAPASVYRTTASPDAVLGLLGNKREQEVVIDPSSLAWIEQIATYTPNTEAHDDEGER